MAFSAGIIYFFSYLLYFKAAELEEISRVIPLVFLSPLYILVLAHIFLGERLSLIHYLGVIFLMVGAILISGRSFSNIRFNSAFWLMIACSFLLAIVDVITKYILDFADSWTAFSYLRIGMFAASIPFLCRFSGDSFLVAGKHGIRIIVAMIASSIITLAGLLVYTVAIGRGSVTLVTALSSVQPFFVLFFVVILSVYRPQVLKEELGKSILIRKFLAIALIFIGAMCII